ncbi:MAG: GIY-YIG nuclease family protein [Anaerolineae bacterium]
MSEPSKGTYALVLHLGCREEITVGKLGTFTFPAGYYLYVGSALGPGGLEARLARHRRRDKRLRWHIDYLLERAQLVEVWSAASTDKSECLWAQVAWKLPGGAIPVPGFVSSDCRCLSHLIYLARKPAYEEFIAKLPTSEETLAK